MSNSEKRTIAINAVSQMKGDDLVRAKMAFRNMTVKDYEEKEHGQSGKTPAQIVKEYEAHNAKMDEVIAWLEKCQ